MALKDNLDAVKKEIGTEEQFLEGIIKSERFFKRYKKYIISAVIVLVVSGSAYAVLNVINENRLQSSNEAYSKLLLNPKDTNAEKTLKEKNERLYNFYRFQKALSQNNAAVLKELAAYKTDPLISDLASYQLASEENKVAAKSELLQGFIFLEEGYKLLQSDKIKEAKLKFAQIDLNSPLKNIANNLEHYQGKKSKGIN
ncbi:hypothetical protein [Sulfurospirillum arcachonense]|uniref:hypothetical protein n=1 Tax=Sulfurospirillum arcachonense TaxID=57666 RepID=UPI0004681769|nr:hypothetical protein [Sulfurospirillum arcachonense]